MTGSIPIPYFSNRGTVYYHPPNLLADKPRTTLPAPPCRPRQRRPHSIHITRLPAGFVPFDLRPPPHPRPKKPSRARTQLTKLASRDSAKRVIGSVFSSFSSTKPTAASASSSTRSPSPQVSRSQSTRSTDRRNIFSRRPTSCAGGLEASTMSGPGPGNDIEAVSGRLGLGRTSLGNSASDLSIENTSSPSLSGVDTEKPVASSNGVYVYVKLAEPIIYLSGLDHDGTTRDSSSNSTAILRGKLQLNITKSAKIKAVTLKFTGRARTEWPEGIPPAKTETFEEDSLRTQVLPFFNAAYVGSEVGYGTLCNYVLRDKVGNTSVTPLSSGLDSPGFSLPILGRNRSSTLMSSRETKRLSLQSNQSRSFGKGDSPYVSTPQQKGYKIFHPGVYEYNFEIPIDNNSPETTKLPLASVIWQLEAFVERAGTFRPNLQGFKEVPVIRTPSIESLELVEPISISRNWEDQLHYEIMISGKSFPLGSRIPIAFKLTPLAKVHVHKIKVLVTENLEYTTSNRKVTRKDTQKKLLLIEKSAGRPLAKEYSHQEVRVLRGGESSPEERAQARASAMREREREARRLGIEPLPLPEPTENMLGDLDLGLDHFIGSTELEMSVQLPTCEMMEKDKSKRLVHDCTWKNVSTHHWIKIVMRISRKDPEDPTGKKRRHFEISIDSPFTILSCQASQPQLALPAYADIGNDNNQTRNRVCGCPNAEMNGRPSLANLNTDSFDNLSLASPARPETAQPLRPPPQAHLAMHNAVQRPIHMLRNPSYNPPAFDAEDPPPPMPTPPPMYDQVVGTPSHDGLADYFSRLSEEYDDEDHTDDEDVERAVRRGRVNVAHPHTPGGRINRSMEISRDFMFTTAGRRYDRQPETDARATTTMAT